MIMNSFAWLLMLMVVSRLCIGYFAPVSQCSPCTCTTVPSKLLHRWLKRADCRNKNLTQFPNHLPEIVQDIDVSFNNINPESLENLSLYENLLSLSMRNCDLKTLSSTAFQNLTSLILLDVTGNRFEKLRGTTFSDLQSLRFLFGLETNSVDEDLFKYPHQLRELEITLHQPYPPGNLFHGLQLKTLSLNLSSSNTISDAIFHIANHSLQEVTLVGAKLSKLPNQLFYGLVMLHKLTIHTPNLETIPEYIFKGYNEVTTLKPRVEKKGQVKLNEWLNSAPSNLVYIELSGIKSIPSGLFQHQRSLETLKLTGVGKIPLDLFAGLRTLNTLDLRGCMLQKVPKLQDMSGLRVLNMSKTNLHFLQPDILTGLHSLRTLDLSYNDIMFIPAGVFTEVGITLTHLNLSHNALLDFQPEAFENVLAVRFLDLGSNNIAQLDSRLFSSQHNLQVLNLGNNSIVSLPDTIFREQENLVSLNLSQNSLKVISDNLLANAMALTFFDVSWNQLKSLPSNLMQTFDRISLAGNPLHCDCSLYRILMRNSKSEIDGKCVTPHLLNETSLLNLNMSTECLVETSTDTPTTESMLTESPTTESPAKDMMTISSSDKVMTGSENNKTKVPENTEVNSSPRNRSSDEKILDIPEIAKDSNPSHSSSASSTSYITNSYWFIAGMCFIALILCVAFTTVIYKWTMTLIKGRVYEVNE